MNVKLFTSFFATEACAEDEHSLLYEVDSQFIVICMAENTQFIPVGTQSVTAIKLKQLAAKGAAWTFAGYGTQQILRFANKIILARLLLPEIFGLSALVDVFILGLTFFSDIGINLSIIQNKRGDDPTFLNTAWTMQVVRGIGLFLVTCLLAYPASQFYGESILAVVLPVAALSAVANGLNSTKLSTANRQLMMRELTLIELGSYITGLAVMITWAVIAPSIWAIVAGNLTTNFLRMVLSHVALPGHRVWFGWNREVFDDIFRFGRWIFVSTSLAFLASQSDRLIIGKLMTVEFLGIYSIAFMLASMVNQGIMQLGHKVFFPSYSKLVRDDPQQLYGVLRQARVAMVALNGMAVLVFLSLGRWLIPMLFGDNFASAGWMLQIIAVGTMVGVLSLTYDHVLIAKGQTKAVATLFAIQFVIQTIALITFANLWGEIGVVMAVAAVGWLIYPFKAFWMRRQKLWQPELDVPAIGVAISVAVIAAVWLF